MLALEVLKSFWEIGCMAVGFVLMSSPGSALSIAQSSMIFLMLKSRSLGVRMSLKLKLYLMTSYLCF